MAGETAVVPALGVGHRLADVIVTLEAYVELLGRSPGHSEADGVASEKEVLAHSDGIVPVGLDGPVAEFEALAECGEIVEPAGLTLQRAETPGSAEGTVASAPLCGICEQLALEEVHL